MPSITKRRFNENFISLNRISLNYASSISFGYFLLSLVYRAICNIQLRVII